ncbi:MAG: hypothetical protein JRI25_09730 [Deltaproteobacteria bacterium]|nr:hypothetical protein [Deltaproteobacteria bacterium]
MSLRPSLLLALALTVTGCKSHLEDCSNGEDDDGDGFADCLDQDCYDGCSEDCSDGQDNDGDGLPDCLDDDCQCPEDCDNGEDDDGDGFVDCLDQDCFVSCSEDCSDGYDNDGDGLPDCWDDDCQCPEDCDNGEDDDGDGYTDCLDQDCHDSCSEDCSDGYDNDGDGLPDCWDDDCLGECPEDCDNGEDDDGDSAIDCADDDCDGGCPEVCDDTRDNDGDGATDCADIDCDGTTAGCPEVCDDGRDNDGDGLLDCEDGDCTTCTETVCDDGLDGDIDGLIDCADEDCWGNGCTVTIATLQGGSAVIQRWKSSASSSGWHTTASGVNFYGFLSSELQVDAFGYSLYGNVVVHPATGSTVTCTWQVDSGSVHLVNQLDYGVRYATTSWLKVAPTWVRSEDDSIFRRRGFQASSGCPFQTSGFLPWRHRFVPDNLATIDGGLWYAGSTTGYTLMYQSGATSESSTSYAYSRQHSHQDAYWIIPSLIPSDPYVRVHY